ncbi:Trk system potassium uptake protein TrkH [Candidatus Desulfarcum epimagneticum]|uniref:Trk system potassium uptake protein TrkH n=1 Tax=uncultured Desulfobacteraceae bacterium TaxID=218296 RepID=A0A484HLH4_9BACT|nr:Trk system potassium uptake protein TrkH [uncultured Desulfobacteraceae bacterium]
MRWRYVLNITGVLIFFLGFLMTLPILAGLYYHEENAAPLLISMLITVFSGLFLFLFSKSPPTDYMSQREGMAIVAAGWSAVGLFGALPFYLTGEFPGFVDALFESVSGFTTTGASILTDIQSISKALLFWRSFIQWLGGMGIIVLSVAILPFLGVGGMQLYKAEVPTPVPDKLKPHIRDTAMTLWKVYALFTVGEALLLMAGGMGAFDAVCHAFTTMPTGGFSTQNASIAHYDSVYIDCVIMLFMILAGVNFSLHYQMLKGSPLALWQDPECKFFLRAVLVLTALVSLNIYGNAGESIGQSIRLGAFQVISIITTTGFATADYETWPAMSRIIILLCMFAGASAGSTGGGMKILRIMLYLKYCYKELFSTIHPRAVKRIKIGGRAVSEDVIQSVLGFLGLYVGIFVAASILLAALGLDFMTAIGAAASAIGNIGPGFGLVGPVENYSQMPLLGKYLLIWCMLLGRLEIFTVIILLVPEFWRK